LIKVLLRKVLLGLANQMLK